MGVGCREWAGFRRWMSRNLDAALTSFLGNVEVVYDGKTPVDPAGKYVFGYAPHGLFPIGALRPLTGRGREQRDTYTGQESAQERERGEEGER